jgi:mono/diheme cytochrome c family protein
VRDPQGRLAVLGALVLALALLAGCDTGTEERSDVTSTRATMQPSDPIPEGSVPRGASASAGAGPAGGDADLGRGEERYAIFCTPCHGPAGEGNGAITRHGYPHPPSLHEGRLQGASRERIAAVIANGVGRMYPMADQIPPGERWAIAAYVKALQARAPADRGTPQ